MAYIALYVALPAAMRSSSPRSTVPITTSSSPSPTSATMSLRYGIQRGKSEPGLALGLLIDRAAAMTSPTAQTQAHVLRISRLLLSPMTMTTQVVRKRAISGQR